MEDCGVSGRDAAAAAAVATVLAPTKPVSTRAWYIFIASKCERDPKR